MPLKSPKTIVVDTETTGLDPQEDELLQISIIDALGKTVLDTLVQPTKHSAWVDAMNINHITPKMVSEAPTLEDLRPKLERIFSAAELVIGYNVNFDLNFFSFAKFHLNHLRIIDVMWQFSDFYADEQEKLYKGFGFYEPGEIYLRECDHRHKLSECAAYFQYCWDGTAHNSLADAKATLYCHLKMIEQQQSYGSVPYENPF